MPGSSSAEPAAPLPELIAISDRRLLPPGGWDGWVGSLAAAGVGALQVREKDLPDRELLELVRRARGLLRPPGRLLVNGRADVALAAGADGVHLPVRGVPAAALRRRLGGRLILGRSTHSPAEVEAAARERVDYVLFGPVWPTPEKMRYGAPVGIEALHRATATGLPVFAVGGVTIERIAEAAAAGAAGVAAIRLFAEPERLAETVAAARRAFRPATSP